MISIHPLYARLILDRRKTVMRIPKVVQPPALRPTYVGERIPVIDLPRSREGVIEITDVRVARLSERKFWTDFNEEGIRRFPLIEDPETGRDRRWSMGYPQSVEDCAVSASAAFQAHWVELHGVGPPVAFDDPEVWVIHFRLVESVQRTPKALFGNEQPKRKPKLKSKVSARKSPVGKKKGAK